MLRLFLSIPTDLRANRLARDAFVCLFVFLFSVQAGAEQSAGSWRPLPWHLVDYNYTLPDTGPFNTLEMDMEIKGNAKKGMFLYLSPLWGRLDQTGFYFGLQTDIFDKGRSLGKGLIFSRWGKGRHSDGRAGPDGWSFIGEKATSGEGDFVSIRTSYGWKPGRYTFLLKTRKAGVEDSNGIWVDLLIHEQATGKWIDGGGLRFPGSRPHLRKRVVSFVEIYHANKRPLLDVPPNLNGLSIFFSPPRVNSSHRPTRSRASFYPKVPRRVKVSEGAGGVSLTIQTENVVRGKRGPSDDRLD